MLSMVTALGVTVMLSMVGLFFFSPSHEAMIRVSVAAAKNAVSCFIDYKIRLVVSANIYIILIQYSFYKY